MRHYPNSFKVAFGSTWSIFGILTTAFSVFNLLLKLFSIPTAKLLSTIIKTYRTTFHGAINFIMHFFPHLTLKIWQKNAIVIWLVLGTVTYRTITYIISSNTLKSDDGHFQVNHKLNIINWLLQERWRHLLLLSLTITIWPILIILLFTEPYAMSTKNSRSVLFFNFHPGNDFLYDIRIVFFFQFIAIFLAVLLYFLVNWLYK